MCDLKYPKVITLFISPQKAIYINTEKVITKNNQRMKKWTKQCDDIISIIWWIRGPNNVMI